MLKPSVELNLALDAISTDLDAMGDEIATVAGQQAQLTDDLRGVLTEVRAVGHKLDCLIDLMRERVLPAVDEIDNLRARTQRSEDRLSRAERQLAAI